MTEADSELVYDLAQHEAAVAMKGIMDAIKKKLAALGKPELMSITCTIAFANAQSILTAFANHMSTNEREIYDVTVKILDARAAAITKRIESEGEG